jgi:hypothetical protein
LKPLILELETMNASQPIGRVMIREARLAFPALFVPRTVNGEGKPRYSATLLLQADDPQLAGIKKAIQAVAREQWKDKAPAILASLEKVGKVALRNGEEKSQYDGFEGTMFVSASAYEDAPPTVCDAVRQQLTERSGKPYAGCYVNASVEFKAQDGQYGKRIVAKLRGVQFWRDGDSFVAGTRPASVDEFDEIDVLADDFA